MPSSDASKFQRNSLPVDLDSDDNESETSVHLIDSEVPADATVTDYQFKKIKKPGEGSYAYTKKKYGPLAATDPDRIKKDQKAGRFKISPILRNPLSIEQEEKKAIKEVVQQEVDSIRSKVETEAKERGYKVGLEQGHQEAYSAFQADGAVRIEEITKLSESFENAKSEIFKQNEKFLMEMIYQICEMIVLRELETDKEYVARLSQEILERIGVRENVRIQINPKDVESIGLLNEKLKEKFGGFKNLQIETSEKVDIGGCRIETEWNAIDASIRTQLSKIQESTLSRKASFEEEKSDSTEELVDNEVKTEETIEAKQENSDNQDNEISDESSIADKESDTDSES